MGMGIRPKLGNGNGKEWESTGMGGNEHFKKSILTISTLNLVNMHIAIVLLNKQYNNSVIQSEINGRRHALLEELHCVSKKTSPTFLAITRESIDGFFIIFGRNVTEKASNHMLLYFSTSPN